MKNTRKILASVALAAAVGGCASNPPAQLPASQAERQAATAAYMNCLIPYAKRLDDGRSDAKTIAQAMRGACGREVEAVYETASRGENEAVKQGIRHGMSSIEESTALQIVLANRNSK